MNQKQFDKLGVFASTGCLIHCILFPIIIPMIPMFGFIPEHSAGFHIGMTAVVWAIAIPTMIMGFRKHKDIRPAIVASIGCLCILCGGLFEAWHFHEGGILTIFGSIQIVISHILNHKFSCSCKHYGDSCH